MRIKPFMHTFYVNVSESDLYVLRLFLGVALKQREW